MPFLYLVIIVIYCYLVLGHFVRSRRCVFPLPMERAAPPGCPAFTFTGALEAEVGHKRES